MGFRYRVEEQREEDHLSHYATSDNALYSPLDCRGHYFLWAFLVSEALQQATAQAERVVGLFDARIKQLRQHWPDDARDTERLRNEWSPLLVEVVADNEVFLIPREASTTRERRPRIGFKLRRPAEVICVTSGVEFRPLIRLPISVEQARQVARTVVVNAIEALAPSQGKLPPELPEPL